MSENVTLDRNEFEKLKQHAKATRAAQLQYGIALGMFGSKLRAPLSLSQRFCSFRSERKRFSSRVQLLKRAQCPF